MYREEAYEAYETLCHHTCTASASLRGLAFADCAALAWLNQPAHGGGDELLVQLRDVSCDMTCACAAITGTASCSRTCPACPLGHVCNLTKFLGRQGSPLRPRLYL